MSDPTFGLSIIPIDNEPRPAIVTDMSIVGLVFTAPAADVNVFPLNTPVRFYSSDTETLAKMGETGTGYTAVNLINQQLGEFQSSATIVGVRVEAGANNAETIANLVGSVNERTGMYTLLNAGALLGITPRLICVPGFTSQVSEGATANGVIAGLPTLLDRLLAVAVVDGPATNETEENAWRATIQSKRIIPVGVAVKVLDDDGAVVVTPASPAIIGIAVRRDHEFQGRPFHSWANQPVYGIVGPSRPIEFSILDGATEGQQLLSKNIGIIVRGESTDGALADGGFVFVGTDTCSEDPLWTFYNQVRGRDYIHLMFIKTLRYFLGRRNIDRGTIEDILATMTGGLRDIQAANDLLGFRVNFARSVNSPEQLRLGRFTVSFKAEEPPVLRYIGIQSARYRPALDDLLNDLLTSFDA
ncbi:phage tail protein [Brucella pseudogrignonensis]|uniref:Phage tail sheath protein FI n=1 Tax=Brucella pseudogrignonensis TaxID=419475 RepID=A0ABU1M5I9_9HYPH|nr:phage tail protein [Brucella pseudogrignonensis]MDR6431310.1 phage tail sheath protein FI [Brucella pseudogrignonensis]